MKKAFKYIAVQLHLWLGIFSGLVVFIVALTGSLLVFEEELEPLINKSFHVVSSYEGKSRLSLDSLTNIVSTRFPAKKMSRITIQPEEDRTIVMALKNGKKEKDILSAAINPYTGEITGSRNEQDTFFEVVLRLHRYLCLGETGKIITGISCVMFLILMITGLVLWWPNRKNQKQRFRVKWNASFKRLNWDLHAVFGFYVLPFAFLIALTGLVWSYKWVNNLIYLALDGKPQQKKETPLNIAFTKSTPTHFEQVRLETDRQLPNHGKISILIPEKDSLSITVTKVDDQAAIANIVSTLYFDKNSGKLISKLLYKDETTGFKARRIVFPVHTGSLLGWPTKIIAFIVALITSSLPITGFIIWFMRKFKGKTKTVKAGIAGSKTRKKPAVLAEMSLKK